MLCSFSHGDAQQRTHDRPPIRKTGQESHDHAAADAELAEELEVQDDSEEDIEEAQSARRPNRTRTIQTKRAAKGAAKRVSQSASKHDLGQGFDWPQAENQGQVNDDP